MGEHESRVGPPKQGLLAEACGEEEVVGEGRSKSSSSTTSTSSSASAGAPESPRASPDGLGAESRFPVCPNCQLRHPGGKSKDSFCTEGKQGMLETLVAMGTLGLVSAMHMSDETRGTNDSLPQKNNRFKVFSVFVSTTALHTRVGPEQRCLQR